MMTGIVGHQICGVQQISVKIGYHYVIERRTLVYILVKINRNRTLKFHISLLRYHKGRVSIGREHNVEGQIFIIMLNKVFNTNAHAFPIVGIG